MRSVAGLILIVAVGGCVSSPSWIPAGTAFSDPTEIDVRILGDLPFVRASLDGRDPAWFIVDTGASNLFLHSGYARSHGFEIDDAGRTRIRSLAMGRATFTDVTAMTIDLPGIQRILGSDFAGVMGVSIFRKSTLFIDYRGERLILTRRPLDPDRIDTLHYASDIGVPWIKVSIGGLEELLLVDSGASAFLALPLKAEAEIPFVRKPVYGFTAETANGREQSFMGRLSGDLKIASHTVKNPCITLIGNKSLLGGTLLRHFVLGLDQERKLIRFDRRGSGPITSPPVRSSGVAILPRDGRWIVDEVLVDSKAFELNVRKGDEIRAIDGIDVRELDPAEWGMKVRTQKGIQLVVRRGGVDREVTIPVETRVP